MNKILEKKQLSENVFYMKFEAADIAKNRKAGQFLIVQVDQDLTQRIPLTIAGVNAENGTVKIIFQVVGATTTKLSAECLTCGKYSVPSRAIVHVDECRHLRKSAGLVLISGVCGAEDLAVKTGYISPLCLEGNVMLTACTCSTPFIGCFPYTQGV